MTVTNQISWNDNTPEKASTKDVSEHLTRARATGKAFSAQMKAFMTTVVTVQR